MTRYGTLGDYRFADVKEAADDIRGSKVYGFNGEKLGEIDDVLQDTDFTDGHGFSGLLLSVSILNHPWPAIQRIERSISIPIPPRPPAVGAKRVESVLPGATRPA